MHPNQDWIDELIEKQRPGYSLDQAFYMDGEIFARDCQRVFPNHWIMAAHESQIPNEGDYLLFELAGESIILVRGASARIFAHFNVCRHRGSQVLLEPQGHCRNMTCRYHGWTYALDGSLRAAHGMPEDFQPCENGLKPCHVTVLEGLILVCLAEGEPPDLEAVCNSLRPFLQLHGTASAKIARRQFFPVAANWKLAIENYLECYHCKPAHPQYCKVEIKVDKSSDGSPAALERFSKRYESWCTQAERTGTMLPDVAIQPQLDERLPTSQIGAAYRAPLREGFVSATENGQAAAPLMGKFSEYDGGETALSIGPFSYMLASNDHVVFFQFVPRDAQSSDMIVTWLVDSAAEEGRDYDLERICWLWTVTTKQDKTIIEFNAAGIASSRYEPGRASLLESDVSGFRNWYLAMIGLSENLRKLQPNPDGRYFGL